MANELNENDVEVVVEGKDVNVINKQLPVTVGTESVIYQIAIWVAPLLVCGVIGYVLMNQYGVLALVAGLVVGLIPGIMFAISKVNAENYLLQLQQKLQHDASQIDNYLEQRVVILKNAAKLLEKAIDLDKDTFSQIARLRSGSRNDNERNELAQEMDVITKNINVAFESYPELKAHSEIEDVLQQNSYLQKEITAAREVYNDTVLRWNSEIYSWPAKKIVAAKKGYTTRVPFIASKAMKDEAREVLF